MFWSPQAAELQTYSYACIYIERERAGDMHTDMYVFDYYKHLCISMYT